MLSSISNRSSLKEDIELSSSTALQNEKQHQETINFLRKILIAAEKELSTERNSEK
jgi:hypothetical protein